MIPENQSQSTTAKRGLAAGSLLVFTLWVVIILNSRGAFQEAHGTDPLALIDILFPSFWILVTSLAIISFASIFMGLEDVRLHILFIAETSLVLYFTPFLISGFSWSPDSLWHGGVAQYMPDILAGTKIWQGQYANSYPLSYMLTYCTQRVLGIDIFNYTLYMYPIISITITAIIAYLFIKRLCGAKVALVSIMGAMPTLHFIEPHVSPFSMGTILVFGLLLALSMVAGKAKIVFFILALAVILTHPISPISLGVFIICIAIIEVLNKIRFLGRMEASFKNITSRVSLETVSFLVVAWFAWTISWASVVYKGVWYSIYRVVTLQFMIYFEKAVKFTTKQGFIYGYINNIELIVYGLLMVFPAIAILRNLRRWLSKENERSVNHIEVLFALASVAYAVFSYALFLSSGDHHLLGRGLVFFAIMASVNMAITLLPSTKLRTNQKLGGVICLALVLFFYSTFPLVSYSTDAYNTYTPTQKAGFTFISKYADTVTKSFSSSSDQQLMGFVDPRKSFVARSTIDFPPNMTIIQPDYIAMHTNAYFVYAMRYDMSFQNNTYTRIQTILYDSVAYDRVYSNVRFELYYKNTEETGVGSGINP
jgi:hypothetical protein